MEIPAFIKAISKFCDRAASRYALSGIECKSLDGVAQLTASDGHCLANVYWPDSGPAMDVLVDGKQLASPSAADFRSGVEFTGSVLKHGGSTTTPAPLDGRFPKIEQVLTIHEDAEGYIAVTLDAALLRKLCDLCDAMNDAYDTKGITLYVKDYKSAVFATARSTEGHTARLAIMPRAPSGEYLQPPFPPRPAAAESEGKGQTVAGPPPECLDDEAIAAAVTAEPATIDDFGTAVSPL